MDAASTLEPGTRLGEYVVERLLARQEDVDIHLASQPSLDRTVELHVFDAPAGTPGADAFLVRARALACIEHPNVLVVYDAGVAAGRAYAAARPSSAPSAAQVVAGGPLHVGAAVAVIEQVAGALEELARAGVAFEPDANRVLLAGDRAAPTVLLSPLEGPLPVGPPADSLVTLLDTLAGPRGARVSAAVRGATSTGSPSAVAAAARAALPSRSRRRGVAFALALAGVVAVAIAAPVLTDRSDDSGPSVSATAPGRIAATVPVGGEPVSMVAAGGVVWVATTDNQLVRIDPATDRVVGAPVRLGRGMQGPPIDLVAGGTSLYVIAGEDQQVLRLDSRSGRVLRHRRIPKGTPRVAALLGDTLWVARSPFDDDKTGQSVVLPLDARSLRPNGPPVPVGSQPVDVRADGRDLLVVGGQDGTLSRVDTRTGMQRRVLVSPQPGRAALVEGRLWVPDAVAGTLTALSSELTEAPSVVVPIGRSAAVVATEGSLWVLLDPASDANAHGRLLRVDPRDATIRGAAIELGRAGDAVMASEGQLWVASRSQRSVLRIEPARRAPSARLVREPEPTKLRSGPSRAGRRDGTVTGLPVSLDPVATGWSVTTLPELIDLRQYDNPGIGLSIMVPAQVYGAKGSARPARDAAQLLRALRRVPQLEVTREQPTRVSGMQARAVIVRAAPSATRATHCGGPCVSLYGRGQVTQLVDAPASARLTVLDVRGRVVAILEDTPDGRSLPRTQALVGSLRFR